MPLSTCFAAASQDLVGKLETVSLSEVSIPHHTACTLFLTSSSMFPSAKPVNCFHWYIAHPYSTFNSLSYHNVSRFTNKFMLGSCLMLKTSNLNKFVQFKIWAQPLLLYFYFAEISSKPYAHKTSALTTLEP